MKQCPECGGYNGAHEAICAGDTVVPENQNAFRRCGNCGFKFPVEVDPREFKCPNCADGKDAPESGFGERHEAHRYRCIHAQVNKMGGWANFLHYVNNSFVNDYEKFKDMEIKLELAAQALKIASGRLLKYASIGTI